MSGITPHLWFHDQAVEAAESYCQVFPNSAVTGATTLPDTPSGDTDVVWFELLGQPFTAISAGPRFDFNPSVSFLVACGTPGGVDGLWNALADGGTALMPIDSYPFSDRYGWVADRYGLSWQLMYVDGHEGLPRITPKLMFVGAVCGQAEEAVRFYTSVFPHSGIGDVDRYGSGEEPEVADTVRHADFRLQGQRFAAMDSAHDHTFAFNEAISFMVACGTQDEIDFYWNSLSAVPEAEQCGWLKDRFGLSWQVVPAAMDDMLRTGTTEQVARVTEESLAMKKFDLAALQAAYHGS